MPTVEVTSDPLTPSARLRTALRLTRWLTARGSATAHVVVSFRAAEPMAYFAGGVPLTTWQDGTDDSSRPRWASVVCRVHPDRDRAYRAALADEVRQALGLDRDDAHLTVRFEPTEPGRMYYLEAGSMTSADAVPAGRGPQKGQ
ncbi:hypothetical protein [Streptomyces minutiscleroticus]|uniref:Uncharacterized protein n=1 Tax=Streptomyces minutiscleroticus TaxID=68238 RepID=A0A918P142_9ACTN|nr:hypothetical protein [Streptomyces minutiscleroticus]GGY11737.1 hypothetical protein GCM10010358_75140 [Streptomyces minutiscleroticus]